MDALNKGERITGDMRKNDQILTDAEALEQATAIANEAYDQLMIRIDRILQDRGVYVGAYISGTRNALYKIDEIHKGVDEGFEPYFSLNCRLVLEFNHDLSQVRLGCRKSFHCLSDWRPAVEADLKAIRRRPK